MKIVMFMIIVMLIVSFVIVVLDGVKLFVEKICNVCYGVKVDKLLMFNYLKFVG